MLNRAEPRRFREIHGGKVRGTSSTPRQREWHGRGEEAGHEMTLCKGSIMPETQTLTRPVTQCENFDVVIVGAGYPASALPII